MTLTIPQRLNDANLAEIARRIGSPMNDDGLRAWYRQDGGALLEEVFALRRERAAGMAIFAQNPPIEGLDQATPLPEVASQLAQLWTEQQQGVWQKAEVKRIRAALAAEISDRKTVDGVVKQRAARIVQLETDLASVKDALLNTQRQLSATMLAAQEQINRLEQERDRAVTELGETKLAANRAITATQKAYADRAGRMRAVLEQAAGVLKEE
jgi:hypothetical protein